MKKMKYILLVTVCMTLLMTGCATTTQKSAATNTPIATTEPASTTESTTDASEPTDGCTIYIISAACSALQSTEQNCLSL